jgi:hypothetical protein
LSRLCDKRCCWDRAFHAASTPIHAVLEAGKTLAPFSVNLYECTVK